MCNRILQDLLSYVKKQTCGFLNENKFLRFERDSLMKCDKSTKKASENMSFPTFIDNFQHNIIAKYSVQYKFLFVIKH